MGAKELSFREIVKAIKLKRKISPVYVNEVLTRLAQGRAVEGVAFFREKPIKIGRKALNHIRKPPKLVYKSRRKSKGMVTITNHISLALEKSYPEMITPGRTGKTPKLTLELAVEDLPRLVGVNPSDLPTFLEKLGNEVRLTLNLKDFALLSRQPPETLWHYLYI